MVFHILHKPSQLFPSLASLASRKSQQPSFRVWVTDRPMERWTDFTPDRFCQPAVAAAACGSFVHVLYRRTVIYILLSTLSLEVFDIKKLSTFQV